MIADSPYQTEDLVLTPRAGAAAGVLGSILMVVLVGLTRPIGSVLDDVGRTVLPGAWVQPGWQGNALGLGVQAAVGAVLGLLYASSLRHAPRAAMLVTGVVFGVMIWVGARIVSAVAFGGMRDLIHSWAWFFLCVAYGVVLAVVAVLIQRFRPTAATVVLKD